MERVSSKPDQVKEIKTILITGSSGFIGHFLVEEAIRRNYRITVAVRKSSDTSGLKKKDAEVIVTDFSDSGTINETISGLPVFDYVIHNAGISKTVRKEDFMEVNYGNTRRLIEAFKLQNRIPGKFLFMSSLAAYGPGDSNSSQPLDTLTNPAPLTRYGQSKLAADRFITEESGIPFIILHPTAVYGPGDKDFFQTIKLMQQGFDFRIGSRPQHLSFIYVKDLVRLTFDALESSVTNQSYLVSDGNSYTNADLSCMVSGYLKRKLIHIAIPVWLAWLTGAMAELFSRITGNPSVLSREKIAELSARNWNCDTRPLGRDFHFKAEYNLEKGMPETIEWYRKEGWLK